MKGKLITFEGAEGSGKSTQAKMLCRYLKEKKIPVVHLREPGGVRISESIRRILLDVNNVKMNNECEVLLYMAARAQLVQEKIIPALKKGAVVLCDRFLDSTIVYQGFGNGVNIEDIEGIGKFATLNISPQMTILFDIDTKKGLSRTGRIKDRIERRALSYHNRVRKGYLILAKKDPKRIKVIRVNRNKEEIFKIVKSHINPLLGLS